MASDKTSALLCTNVQPSGWWHKTSAADIGGSSFCTEGQHCDGRRIACRTKLPFAG